jgi:hypothetical protein
MSCHSLPPVFARPSCEPWLAKSLEVFVTVEVIDQHVILVDLSRRHGCDHHRVGILVTIDGHPRGQGDVVMDGWQERIRLGQGKAW